MSTLIEAAFDGVPPPDPRSSHIVPGRGVDNYETCDRSRAHLGRWQDIPAEHFAECAWALPHLDGQGIRYYLPALMMLYLERADLRAAATR